MNKYIQKLCCFMVLVCALGIGIDPVLFARPLVDIGGEGYDDPDLITNEDARYLEDRTMREDIPTHVPKWREREREKQRRHDEKYREKRNKKKLDKQKHKES